MNKISFLFIIVVLVVNTSLGHNKDTPNIVIIYADDMGYGDLNCQNPNSKIPTPNLDKLATEGMRFTDAHSSSGICSPSRYALLTGKYHWRKGHGIVGSFGKPYFNNDDVTLPQILKTKGYSTACIGKWHLGWNWNYKNKASGTYIEKGKEKKCYLPGDIDWGKPISGGPLDRGFDYYFGDGTINFPPYTWIENDKVLKAPNDMMWKDSIDYVIKEGACEFRTGPKVKGWDPYEVLPTITQRTIDWISEQDKNNPFFLYLALPSPHAPIIPNDEFDGKSEAGAYGDFMFQTDWVAGQVIKALKDHGFDENTIVIFSSDNGPENYAFERARKYGHYSMGEFRGLKRDVWEGGHHVPLIVKWADNIKAGSISNEVISQVDLMATLANLAGADLPENSAPDSYDFTNVLLSKEYESPLREATIHNTKANKWAIRKGDWLYIDNKSGEHTKMPAYFKELRHCSDFDTPSLLFNMKEDPEQLNNRYNNYPDKVDELSKTLHEYRNSKRTVKN